MMIKSFLIDMIDKLLHLVNDTKDWMNSVIGMSNSFSIMFF